ncbi:Palmitoyltransferase [Balamuthia mandrillaris]
MDGFVIGVLLLIAFIYGSAWYTVFIPWEWWTTSWGLCNMALGHSLLGLMLTHYMKTHLTSPGRVPHGWVPAYATEEEMQNAIEYEEQVRKQQRPRRRVWGKNAVRWCTKCEEFKPPRSHHCSDCKACTLKMDHHCPWVGNCVGHYNHKYFFNFLVFATLAMSYSLLLFGSRLFSLLSFMSSISQRNKRHRHSPLEMDEMTTGAEEGEEALASQDMPISAAQVIVTICNFILCIPIVLSIFCLLCYQISLVVSNTTTIEEYELRVMKKRAKRKGESFRWYYDQGFMNNLRMVFGAGSPLHWLLPVRSYNGSGLLFTTCEKEDV